MSRGYWVPVDQHDTILVCPKCGAAVPASFRDIHSGWHEPPRHRAKTSMEYDNTIADEFSHEY